MHDDVEGESDEEGEGNFETEDTIVCQWEKVYMHPTLNFIVAMMLYCIASLKF